MTAVITHLWYLWQHSVVTRYLFIRETDWLPRNSKSTINFLHFNSHSVVNKWTEIEAELQCTAADIVCISETRVTSNE